MALCEGPAISGAGSVQPVEARRLPPGARLERDIGIVHHNDVTTLRASYHPSAFASLEDRDLLLLPGYAADAFYKSPGGEHAVARDVFVLISWPKGQVGGGSTSNSLIPPGKVDFPSRLLMVGGSSKIARVGEVSCRSSYPSNRQSLWLCARHPRIQGKVLR